MKRLFIALLLFGCIVSIFSVFRWGSRTYETNRTEENLRRTTLTQEYASLKERAVLGELLPPPTVMAAESTTTVTSTTSTADNTVQ